MLHVEWLQPALCGLLCYAHPKGPITGHYLLQSDLILQLLVTCIGIEFLKIIVQIEFGAHQVVLVRTLESENKLPSLLGNSILFLTISQAKGLEFDDVLILNFFKDSPALKEWSVLDSINQVGPHRGN